MNKMYIYPTRILDYLQYYKIDLEPISRSRSVQECVSKKNRVSKSALEAAYL